MTDETKTVPAQLQLDEDLNSQAGARAVTNPTGPIVDDVHDNAPQPGPCPAWCTDEPGHDYDSVAFEGDDYLRFHSGREHVFDRDDYEDEQPDGSRTRTPGSVQISMLESNDGTLVTYGRPTITIWNGHDDLTAHEAGRLILCLYNAMIELQELEK